MKTNGALGIIEVQGLVTAITATDAALKAANVTYVNYFKTGNGELQVRLIGDVGAVQAAVAAAKAEASKCGMVTAVTVIPRPHEDLEKLMPEAFQIGKLREDGKTDGKIAEIIKIKRTTFRSQIERAATILAKKYPDHFNL